MNTTIDNGVIKISNEVIACIAKIAIEESNNIHTVSENILDKVLQIKEKAIKVTFNENETLEIDANVQVEFGINIPNAIKELQKDIIENIKIMTGLDVSAVNIKVVNLVEKVLSNEEK